MFTAAGAAEIRGGPLITVPTGLGERPPGNQQPRPGDGALLDRPTEPRVGATRIAHGREPSSEHLFESYAGEHGHLALVATSALGADIQRPPPRRGRGRRSGRAEPNGRRA